MMSQQPFRRQCLRSLATLALSGFAGGRFASATTPVLAAPSAVVPAPGANVRGPAIVLNSRDADVSVIDPESFKVISRVAVGKEPHHLYPTPDNKSVIVANAAGNDLVFLDPLTGTVQRRIRGIDDPYHLTFSPDQKWFCVACNRLDRVDIYRYDGQDLTLAKRIPIAKTPSHLSITSDSKTLLVSLQESHEVAAIDLPTQSILWRIPSTGKQPAGIQISPNDRYLFVGVMGSDHVQVVDIVERKTLTTIKTNAGAHATRPHGDRKHLWVSNRVANTISMIDMIAMKVVAEIPVPNGPDCMEVTADGQQLWLTARWAKQLVVVDIPTRTILKTIPVGRSPHGVYLHQRAGLL